MDSKILFISNRLKKDNNSGGYLGSKRNLENMKTIFKGNIDIIDVIAKNNFFRAMDILFFNRLESSSIKMEKLILEKIKKNNYKIIFLDNSGFGYLAEKIRKNFPKIKIIVFCHDINYYFFQSILNDYKKDKFNINSSLKIIKAKKEIYNAKINEIKSFKVADKIITLNERETNLLKEGFGYTSNIEIPVTFSQNKNKYNFEVKINNKMNILFIGTASLKPNLIGIEFFIKEVLSYIDVELCIIGKGMEKYKEKFEKLNSKVKVLGTVDSLDEYYLNANVVIAPIFSGGGMKVKTAEALSYGKTIFGTKEAFEGYEVDYDKVGGLCNTAEEFIEKINKYIKWWEENNKPKFNEYSETIFKEKYSYESSLEKFKKLFRELGEEIK